MMLHVLAQQCHGTPRAALAETDNRGDAGPRPEICEIDMATIRASGFKLREDTGSRSTSAMRGAAVLLTYDVEEVPNGGAGQPTALVTQPLPSPSVRPLWSGRCHAIGVGGAVASYETGPLWEEWAPPRTPEIWLRAATFAMAHGFSMWRVVENALEHHLDELEALPPHLLVSRRVALGPGAVEEMLRLLDDETGPNEEIRRLLEGDE